MDKAKLIKKSNTLVSRITVITLTFMMLVTGMQFSVMSPLVANAADAGNITTWAELEEALEANAPTITIAEDLYADKTLEIKYQVTIKGKDGQTIFQQKRDSYDTMFKVTGGGDLTLGNNLTLTGETGCASGGGGGGDDDPIQTMTLHIYEGDSIINNYYIALVPANSNTIGYEERPKAVTVEVYNDRTIKYNGNYLGRITQGDMQVYAFDSSITADNAVKLTNVSGGTGTDENPIVPVTEDTSYRLIDGTTGYLGYDANTGLIAPLGRDNSYELKAKSVKPYEDPGSGGGGSGDDQGCDGAGCPDGETYTNVTFPDDQATSTTPKGFFVEVSGGGKATLDGATLKNFITSREKDSAPKHVAPVAVYGAGSTFNVNDGTIKNNIVGYIAEDEKAYESADKIKKYVKGAAPNARRVNPPDRRWADAGIDDGVKGSGITATSGGIIYADGAIGQIKGGSIKFNRGDTGGIMASGTDTNVTLMTNADINNNVGVQFGGGVTTEDDAFVVMYGGTIKENVAWFGGGAVYATQNGVEWLLGNQTKAQRKDGKFVMDGGVIDSNTAFTRGGGFLVDSNGVSLISGVIKNNMSRMLGGGMYVMGDHPDYSYTVTIVDGYVHENKAVSEGGKGNVASDPDNQILSRKLEPPSDSCGDLTKLFKGQMTMSSDDQVDGYPAGQDGTDGTGGGLWLCAYGSTALGLSDDRFIIDKNYASGSVLRGKTTKDNEVYPEAGSSEKAGGNDIHKDTKASGNIVITGIVNDKGKWYDENIDNSSSEAWYTDPDKADEDGNITDFGARNLTNKGDHTPSGYSGEGDFAGVDIFGNLSRRGGGLAGDGTFVLGEIDNIAEAYSELKVTKTWTGDLVPEDVVIRINLEYKDESGNDKVIQVVELPLSKLAGQESELDTTFTDGSETVGGQTVYKGHLVLPITVEDENGKQIQVFDLLAADSGRTFALNTPKGLMGLADHLKTSGKVILSNKERKLTFVELRKDPQTGELVEVDGYEITPTEMKLSSNPAPDIHTEEIVQLQPNGTEEVIGYSITSDIRFEADLTNDKPAEIEKYVNKAVHQNIALDQEFEYDIMAYVKHGTDKLVLTDTLVKDLAFVSGVSDVTVEVLDDNNHKPLNDISGTAIDGNDNATVAKTGTPVTMVGDYKKVEIDSETNKTLTVTIANKLEEVKDAKDNIIGYKNADDDQYLTDLWGKWVRVTYKAQIDPEIQEKIKNGEMTVKDLHSDYVTVKADEKYKPEDSIYGKDDEGEEIYRPTPNEGNAPVESDEDHTGLENTASYSLEVKNEPSFKDESNTVTVKPDEPTVEKYVHQAVHKDIALDEVFTYDIIGYITHDADRVVFEDTLVDCLELTNVDDIKVASLGENNHKPTNDVNGEKINNDASVAEGGTNIKKEDGVKVEAEEGGRTLTVTIDDIVETAPDGTVIDRERETVYKLRGKYVKVTFQAQIKEELQNKIKSGEMTLEELLANEEFVASVTDDENAPVESDEAHDGIKNDATMNIYVGNDGKYNLTSNIVTVKPEQPEIEKYVNQAVHDFIDIDETFTYDIIAYITKDADEVTITDELDSQLEFVSAAEDIAVVDLGEDDNHKVTNNIDAKQVNKDATVAEEGKVIEKKTVTIEGNTLTVKLAPENADDKTVENLRGHWVKITFDAKIKDGLSTKDLEYTEIDATAREDRDGPNVGNDPVLSDESHDGVPNKASYTIGVKNDGEIEEKHKDDSNTVTVKPEEFDVEISKKDPDGNVIAGAKFAVLDSKGVEVASWTSGDTPHKLKLKPGNYTLKEVKAPDGLKTVTTPIKFSVNSDGNVELKTTSVDNDGEVSVSENSIALKNAPVDTDLQKFINYDNKSQKAKKKEDTFEFRIVATVPYGVSKFEITDPIPKPLLYVENSLQIYIDDEFIDETSAVMATEEPDYISVAITSDDDGTIDVSEVYGKDVALVFECKIDPKEDLSKYKDVVNTAYVFLNNSDKPVKGEDDDVKASVLGISDLADKDGKSKKKGANTGDNTPIELAIFGLLASAAAYAIIRRRREN